MRRKSRVRTEGQRLLRAEVDRTSQSEVARRLNKKQAHVQRWYHGDNRPDGDTRSVMYAVFGWNPNAWREKPLSVHSATVGTLHNTRKRRARSGEAVRA